MREAFRGVAGTAGCELFAMVKVRGCFGVVGSDENCWDLRARVVRESARFFKLIFSVRVG